MPDRTHAEHTHADPTPADTHPVEHPEVIEPGDDDGEVGDRDPSSESIEQPAKVMRVGGMLRQLLEELHSTTLDEASRDRLRDIYELSVRELGSALSTDLREELDRLALPFDENDLPSEAEIRVAKAQLVGWLEGLIQGIQATLFAQQMAAQQQLANMRAGLPAGRRQVPPGQPGGAPAESAADARPGTYL